MQHSDAVTLRAVADLDPALVLLDRDGVLNVDLANGVRELSEFRWLPGAVDALRALVSQGRRVVVVTNQANVGRGLLAQSTLDEIHSLVVAVSAGAVDILHCPHAPSAGCRCRKPRPGMIFDALARTGAKGAEALMVGDSATDVAAAAAAGCYSVHVRSGLGTAPSNPPAGYLGSVAGLPAVVAALGSRSTSES